MASSAASDRALGLELFTCPAADAAAAATAPAAAPALIEVVPARGARGALLLAPAAALVPAELARRGVALVVQCAAECAPEEAQAGIAGGGGGGASGNGRVAAAAATGTAVLFLRLRDTTAQPLAGALAAALPRIEAARAGGGAVVVACRLGRSRSVAVAAAHLVAGAEALPLRDALRALRRVQPHALPNFGFLCQLMGLEARARGASSVPPDAAAWHELAFLSHFDPDDPARGRAEAAARAAREVSAGLRDAAAGVGRGGGKGANGSGAGGRGGARAADLAPSGERAAAGAPSGARRR
jgi:hypothetical protein